jgi:hypothetical protein
MLSIDAKKAGREATKRTTIQKLKTEIQLVPGAGIRHVIPQKVTESGTIQLTMRAEKPREASILRVTAKNKEILKKKLPWINPANMIKVHVNIPSEVLEYGQRLEVKIDD